MLYFLLLLSTCFATGKSVLFKKIGSDFNVPSQLFRLNGFSFMIAAVIVFILSGFDVGSLISLSFYSLGISFFIAVSIIVTYLTQSKALALAATSSTMMIYSCGFLIPVFFSAIIYKESISAIDWFALLLLIVAVFLIITPEKNSKPSLKWLLFSVVSMIGSGTTAVLQKVHQHSIYAHEFFSLAVCEFIIAGVSLLVLSFVISKKNSFEHNFKHELKIGLVNGLFLGSINLLNLILSGKLPAIIVFPIYNIGSIILSSIIGRKLYHEKNSKNELWGFIIGCIAIFLIGIF
jgi:drug/metabolite transporter (DMT)-like permease